MDKTKPHLRKFFKTVPMRDEEGRVIPNNPAVKHGGPWEKVDHRIRVKENSGQDIHQTKGRKE